MMLIVGTALKSGRLHAKESCRFPTPAVCVRCQLRTVGAYKNDRNAYRTSKTRTA